MNGSFAGVLPLTLRSHRAYGEEMQRRIGVLAATSALLLLASTAHAADPPPTTDHLRAFSVLPPGQNGFVSLSDALGSTTQPHFRDQLDMYAGLVEDDDVTEDELDDHFKSFAFGPGAVVEREYSPRAGVTIFRDNFGVPHIYGTTDLDAFFGTGYATAEDRLWEMDLFRRAANGRLSELLGPDYTSTDAALRRDAYTDAELDEMLDALDPLAGLTVREAMQAYVDGVNQRIAEVGGDLTMVPAEYQGAPIEDWNVMDVAGLAVFQLRSLGDWGGQELDHADFLKKVRKASGKRRGNKIFKDFSLVHDPDAYSTIPSSEGEFPFPAFGPRDPDSVAIPDNVAQYAKFSRAELRGTKALRALLGARRASNMAAVAPSNSATGNTLHFGGPQVGYQVPQFFLELDVHSPNFDFRGPAVPGASLLVPLGRGIDYAWSLTSGASDNVDVRVEKLCDDDNHYEFEGECVAMEERFETIDVRGGTPQEITVHRTIHGPVFARTTVGGEPVALVEERAYWGRELESIVGLAMLNSNATSTVDDFYAAMERMTMSFNSVFVNDGHIAYIHAGVYPLRAPGHDPALPTWGTGEWEWTGTFPVSQLPRMSDPEQGWLVNWNNRPSDGWLGGDSSGWQVTHRVGLLRDALGARADNATLSDVVDAMRIVATQDARGYFLGPMMTEMTAGMAGVVGTARDEVVSWVDGGAHRRDRDDDGNQDFGPAVVTFDEWYDRLAHRIFGDELGKGIEDPSLPISDDPRNNNGSSHYTDFAGLMWHLLAGDDHLRLDYCDNVKTERDESCRFQVRKSLKLAAGAISQEQGDAVSAWTKPVEKLVHEVFAGKSVPDIDWQNRGTWNHAVEVTGTR